MSVREKSSYQLSDCFIPDVPAPLPSAAGRPATRSQLLERRRVDWVTDNARSSYPVPLTTLPVGVKPGAPGRRDGYHRFSHLDTCKGISYWWGGNPNR
jgi:hypothetical protein